MVRIRQNRGLGVGVMLLLSSIMNIGLERIPPVTLALVVSQAVIFMEAIPYVNNIFGTLNSACVSSYLVLHHQEYRRLILSVFTHADDMHLYFNMVSLLYKGIKLERAFGSPYFAYLIAVFSGLSSVSYVAMSQMLAQVFEDDNYTTTCAVGFSGVLFALKVLATEYSTPGTQYAFGFIPVPSKYFFWAELVMIQMMTPNASFVGHLCGALVGVAYTRGPLKLIMDAFVTPGDYTPGSTPNRSRGASPRATPPTSSTRLQQRGNQNTNQNFGSDYTRYTGGLTEAEQMRRAMQASQQPGGAAQPHHLYPDLDLLRNRRAAFYNK